jgi:hypothetical protein
VVGQGISDKETIAEQRDVHESHAMRSRPAITSRLAQERRSAGQRTRIR